MPADQIGGREINARKPQAYSSVLSTLPPYRCEPASGHPKKRVKRKMLLSLVAVFASLFSLLIVSLCAFGVIPPNRVVGLRTNKTLQSRPTWITVHRRALVPLAVTTVAVAGCWLLYPAGIVGSSASSGFGFIALVAGLLWAWTHGVRGMQHPADHAARDNRTCKDLGSHDTP